MIRRITLILSALMNFIFSNAQVFYKADVLPFNTSLYNEMAPFIYKDGVIFSSNRKNDVVVVTVDQAGNFLYNLYHAKKKSAKTWTSADLLARELSSFYNLSSACISNDGKTLFFTATLPSGKITGDTLKNGIFISQWVNEKWSVPEPFPYNNDLYDVANPHFTEDGRYLYFSSKNPSGFGKYDIYYSEFSNNTWKEPVNIGPKINTRESEVFPFIFRGNRLYFSSAGHNSDGGLDIFYSDRILDEWSNPVKLPKPFNSRYDDFAFVSNANMDTGYFASNRKGTDDIFSFVSTFPAFTECPVQVDETFCYEFYEAGTMVLDTTTLAYEWDLGDGNKVRSTRVNHCYSSPGNYLVQLNVIDTLTGEVYFSEATYALNIEKMEQSYILAPDTTFVNKEIELDATKSYITSFQVKNYFWDFGDGSINSGAKLRHRYTKEGTYTIKLGLVGNPDNELQKKCSKRTIVVIRQ